MSGPNNNAQNENESVLPNLITNKPALAHKRKPTTQVKFNPNRSPVSKREEDVPVEAVVVTPPPSSPAAPANNPPSSPSNGSASSPSTPPTSGPSNNPSSNGPAAPGGNKPPKKPRKVLSKLMAIGIGLLSSSTAVAAAGAVVLVLASIPIVGWAILGAGALGMLVGAALMLADRFKKTKAKGPVASLKPAKPDNKPHGPGDDNKPSFTNTLDNTNSNNSVKSSKKKVVFVDPTHDDNTTDTQPTIVKLPNTNDSDDNVSSVDANKKPADTTVKKNVHAKGKHHRFNTAHSLTLTYAPDQSKQGEVQFLKERLQDQANEIAILREEIQRLNKLNAAGANHNNAGSNNVPDAPASDVPNAPAIDVPVAPPPPAPIFVKNNVMDQIKAKLKENSSPEALKKIEEEKKKVADANKQEAKAGAFLDELTNRLAKRKGVVAPIGGSAIVSPTKPTVPTGSPRMFANQVTGDATQQQAGKPSEMKKDGSSLKRNLLGQLK